MKALLILLGIGIGMGAAAQEPAQAPAPTPAPAAATNPAAADKPAEPAAPKAAAAETGPASPVPSEELAITGNTSRCRLPLADRRWRQYGHTYRSLVDLGSGPGLLGAGIHHCRPQKPPVRSRGCAGL